MPKNDEPLNKSDEAKLAALREALIEGEKSGPPRPFDFDAFLAKMNAKHRTRKGTRDA